MNIKSVILIAASLSIVGCKSINSHGDNDPTAYANVTEAPPLKMPVSSAQLSNRYDIPNIPNENGPIIAKAVPPNF